MNAIDEIPEEKIKKTSLRAKVMIVLLILLILFLGMVFTAIGGAVFSRAGIGRVSTVLNDGKDIYTEMRDYAFTHNGELPPARENANTSLRVLFEQGSTLDEKAFQIRRGGEHLYSPLQADGNTAGEEALKEGELGYTYWIRSDGKPHHLTDGDGNSPCLSIPNLAAPSVTNLKDAVFFRGGLHEWAVVISVDGSGSVYPLSEEGTIPENEYSGNDRMGKSGELGWDRTRPIYPLGMRKSEK